MKVGEVDTYRAAQLRLQEVLLQKAADEHRRLMAEKPHPIINPTNAPDRDKGLKIDVKV